MAGQVANAVGTFTFYKIMENFNKNPPPAPNPTPVNDINSILNIANTSISLYNTMKSSFSSKNEDKYDKIEKASVKAITRISEEVEGIHDRIDIYHEALSDNYQSLRSEKLYRKLNFYFDMLLELVPQKTQTILELKRLMNNTELSLPDLFRILYEFASAKDPDLLLDVTLYNMLNEMNDGTFSDTKYPSICRNFYNDEIRELDRDKFLLYEVRNKRKGKLTKDLNRIHREYYSDKSYKSYSTLMYLGLALVGGILIGLKLKKRDTAIDLAKPLFNSKKGWFQDIIG